MILRTNLIINKISRHDDTAIAPVEREGRPPEARGPARNPSLRAQANSPDHIPYAPPLADRGFSYRRLESLPVSRPAVRNGLPAAEVRIRLLYEEPEEPR